MSRRARTRQARPMLLDPMGTVMKRVQRLSEADVQMQARIVAAAVAEFCRGLHCPQHWRSLADTANVAETLATMGLGSGDQADGVIEAAQRTLHDVWQRQQQRNSWTLYADEIDSLHWLAALHTTQLRACSYGEFQDAIKRTAERVSQAQAGNAPANAIVVTGQINSRDTVAAP